MKSSPISISVLAIISSIVLSSCQVYRSDFDCPPGKGVPCTPVHEIEKMIVESEEGPDLFLQQVPLKGGLQLQSKKQCQFCESGRRVWIMEQEDAEGRTIKGHYIYLQ